LCEPFHDPRLPLQTICVALMRQLWSLAEKAWPQHGELGRDEGMTTFRYLAFCGISVGLVVVAGLMSGLTIGLMAMDDLEIEVRLAPGWRPGIPCSCNSGFSKMGGACRPRSSTAHQATKAHSGATFGLYTVIRGLSTVIRWAIIGASDLNQF
jgi:hypothetical protein